VRGILPILRGFSHRAKEDSGESEANAGAAEGGDGCTKNKATRLKPCRFIFLIIS